MHLKTTHARTAYRHRHRHIHSSTRADLSGNPMHNTGGMLELLEQHRTPDRASLRLESRIFRQVMQLPRSHIPLTLGSSPTGPRNRRCKTQTNTHAHARQACTSAAYTLRNNRCQRRRQRHSKVKCFEEKGSNNLPHEIAHCHIVVLRHKT